MANMLATLKNKNEIMYSLVYPCDKNKQRYLINKNEKKETGVQQPDNHPTQGYKGIRNYIQMIHKRSTAFEQSVKIFYWRA